VSIDVSAPDVDQPDHGVVYIAGEMHSPRMALDLAASIVDAARLARQDPDPCPVTQGNRACVYRKGHSSEFNHRFA
jgi:hypothetical protein